MPQNSTRNWYCAGHGEEAEDHRPHEHVVDRQALLDQEAGDSTRRPPCPGRPAAQQVDDAGNARPIEIQTADSIAASLMVMTCAVRCTSSRSTTTSTTMKPTRANQCHGSTFEIRELLPGIGLFGRDDARAG